MSPVVWAGRDLYPATEGLDGLDASRAGIHHRVTNTSPSHPTMLSHMSCIPCYRFGYSAKSFYISRCIFLHDKSHEYIPSTRRVWPLAQMLSDLFSSLFPCGAHSRSGQASPKDGLWWWCSAWCVSDLLAGRCVARRTQARWKACFTLTYFHWDFSGLLQVGLFLVAAHVIFPFVFWYLGKSGLSQATTWRGHRRFHPSKKMPPKMKATCHTCLQASLHKHEAAGQQ